MKEISILASLLGLCLSWVSGQDASSAAKPALPMTVAPWLQHSKLIHEVPPEFRPSASENHVQRDAIVGILVGENGKVQKALSVECVNCAPLLGEASVKAVNQWEYQPTLVNGNAVRVCSWIVFRFHFEDPPSVEVLSKAESSTPRIEPPLCQGGIPQKLRISSGVAESNLLQKASVKYPEEAKVGHIQGNVILQCIINKHGDVTDLRVVSGDSLLVKAAMDAVKQWRYRPYYLNGEPVEVEATVTVRFRL